MTTATDSLDRNAHGALLPSCRMTRRGDDGGGRTLPVELVRSATSFALRQGWDVDGILAEAGFAPSLLAQGRARVTEGQATRIVQWLWQQTDDEAFGMGSHPLPRGSFRLLLYGAIGAPDLGAAIERIRGFGRAMPALPPVEVAVEGERARLAVDLSPDFDDPEHLVTFTGLAVAHRVISWAIGQPLALTAVELPFRAPRNREMPDLVFGAPQVYGAKRPALTFASSWLRAPLMRDEAALDAFIARSPAGLLARPTVASAGTQDQVRRLVAKALGGRQPSVEEIADRLAMSPQTLRRRLATDGTSVRRIRDELLRDAAVTALVGGGEPVADIAARLGFSEPSAFTRAFRRWTGSPPRAYRSREEPG